MAALLVDTSIGTDQTESGGSDKEAPAQKRGPLSRREIWARYWARNGDRVKEQRRAAYSSEARRAVYLLRQEAEKRTAAERYARNREHVKAQVKRRREEAKKRAAAPEAGVGAVPSANENRPAPEQAP